MSPVINRYSVPTGDILVIQNPAGVKFECLSLGDYGKDVNIKCDALGLSREPTKVRHTALLPLEEKWVITISTQAGCSMGCNFCDVPRVGPGKNLNFWDMWEQTASAVKLHPEVIRTKRLNLHFARMGEPTWNPEVLDFAVALKNNPIFLSKDLTADVIHPVVSTMMPIKNKWLRTFLHRWMQIKNEVYEGDAGLQLSINSTDFWERRRMFNGNSDGIDKVGSMMRGIALPLGRKITLNFAVAGYTVDTDRLLENFSPDKYICKLTPMHKTITALKNDIKTEGDYTEYYPYQELEEKLKRAGYDVLVFIASEEEDMGRITCGNAILSGSTPLIKGNK